MSICPVPAPVVPSEQVKDPSTKGLQKCFDPQCAKKLNSDSCDGIVGCYWCVRDKNEAPLNNKYCADINSCYGGKEGKRLAIIMREIICNGTTYINNNEIIK